MSKNVCVITGGGSGMGLAAARLMGETHHVIISGRTVSKLEGAVDELRKSGISCEAFPCDTGDKLSVAKLAEKAASLGRVQAVIHAAGVSPHMGSAENMLRINAVGTIFVNSEFGKIMGEGDCILDVSSMSAYMLPNIILPTNSYKYALTDPEIFLKKALRRANLFPKKLRSSIAYPISKNFVVWYAKMSAIELGKKGIRVVSVSPGNFETPMGDTESDAATPLLKHAAIKRFGKPEEIAYLFKSIVNEANSYLTATDIICDGGVVAGMAYDKLRK
jgi:NAD(P)-dependent dehydrogenase (short-subunit alcohol dehydrogenase family)